MSADDAGYESESGERNNPTVESWEHNVPVENFYLTSGPTLRWGQRALNRQSRAIVRIVFKRTKLTRIEIARIFGVAARQVEKAVHNSYKPPDRVEMDYEHAGEAYLRRFPPDSTVNLTWKLLNTANGPATRTRVSQVSGMPAEPQSRVQRREIQDGADTESLSSATVSNSNVQSPTPSPVVDSSPIASGSGIPRTASLPVTRKGTSKTALKAPAPPNLVAFLRTAGLSDCRRRLVAAGLDMGLLRKMAAWDTEERRQSMWDLLSAEKDGISGLKDAALLHLDRAVGRLV